MEKKQRLHLPTLAEEVHASERLATKAAVQRLIELLETSGAVHTDTDTWKKLDASCGYGTFKGILDICEERYDILPGPNGGHYIIDLETMRGLLEEDLRSFLAQKLKYSKKGDLVISVLEMMGALKQKMEGVLVDTSNEVLAGIVCKLLEQDNPGFRVEHSIENKEIIISYEMLRLEDD